MEYLIIVVVCLLVYARTWNYQPVVDDVSNRRKKAEGELGRPLLVRLRRNLDGNYPVESIYLDRALTVCIHTITCMLMYKAFGSLVASLLFAVNVSNNQTSIWLNGKRYGISASLCLLAYILAPVGMLFWVLAPIFQPSALTFPLLLALKGYWYAPLVLFPLILKNRYLLKWIEARKARMPVAYLYTWNHKKVILILKTLTFYFFRGLIPFTPCMYIPKFKYFGLVKKKTEEVYRFDLSALFGLILLLGIPYAYYVNPTLSFGLVWWLVTISVYSNWKTLTVLYAERYCYLPNVGLMVFLATILEYIHPQAWLLVFGSYVSILLTYMPMYKGIWNFYTHHINEYPSDDSVWNAIIQDAMDSGDINTAMIYTELSVRNVKDSPRLWGHKANIANHTGNKQLALDCVQKARECSIDELGVHLNDKINNLEKRIKGE